MRSALLLALLAGFGAPAALAAPTSDARAEIDQLFAFLGASSCEFNRNGSWYSAAQAVAHLRNKHDYLDKKGLAKTAEQFIERGASRSSVSGKPYLVRCGDGIAVESGPWFTKALVRIREPNGRSGGAK